MRVLKGCFFMLVQQVFTIWFLKVITIISVSIYDICILLIMYVFLRYNLILLCGKNGRFYMVKLKGDWSVYIKGLIIDI